MKPGGVSSGDVSYNDRGRRGRGSEEDGLLRDSASTHEFAEQASEP